MRVSWCKGHPEGKDISEGKATAVKKERIEESDRLVYIGSMLHARNHYEVKAAIARTRVTMIGGMMLEIPSKRFGLLQDDDRRRAAEEDALREFEAL